MDVNQNTNPHYSQQFFSYKQIEVKRPKSLKFTSGQIEKLRSILSFDKCPACDLRVFAKLASMNVLEMGKTRSGYFYNLTEEGERVVAEIVGHQKKESYYELRARTACWKCDGKGYIPCYGHVEGGRCFVCNGTGRMRA